MTDIQKQKIKLLRSSGKSYRDIADEMGLKESTVKTYCNRSVLTDKDISLMRSKQKNKCLYCGAEIHQIPKQKPKKFCSDNCRFAWCNKNRELKNKKSALYNKMLRLRKEVYKLWKQNEKILFTPHILSLVIAGNFGWRGGYRIAFAIQLIITLLLFLSLPLWRKAHGGENESEENTHKDLSFGSVLKIRG